MILEAYLKNNNLDYRQFNKLTGISESTLRNINRRPIEKWNLEYFDALASAVNKEKSLVIFELEELSIAIDDADSTKTLNGRYNIENRRYIGSKKKLISWISELVEENTSGNSFFDVFAGTGIVTKEMFNKFDEFIINDFLYSNNTVYEGFFGSEEFNKEKIYEYKRRFNEIETNSIDNQYFSDNYGDKFFSNQDAAIIGEIRTIIKKSKDLNDREKSILVASLLYSTDKIANTVGHYDAYRKKVDLANRFVFELIIPVSTSGKDIKIFREDANHLVKKVRADVTFIDPPYNSRQYSRFYHLLEVLAKWEKPELKGVAMKPPLENMSEYSKVDAPNVFDDLISNLDTNYVVVTYNNTYASKSSSSRNKITHEEIIESLNKLGNTQVFEKPFNFFTAGKTDLQDHKEFVFITEVKK